jgi:carbonic anhydrase
VHRFTALLTCIDGRALPTALDWVTANSDVDHVDVITAPGMDGALADGTAVGDDALESLLVSMVAHGTRSVVVVGHDDCAGHPAPPQDRARIITEAMARVAARHPDLAVRGLHVQQSTVGWAAREVVPAVR